MDGLVEVLVCHSFCSGIVDLGHILSDQIQTVMSIHVNQTIMRELTGRRCHL